MVIAMISYPIKSTKIQENKRYIVHTMADETFREYSDVRMGLVWPTAKSPAYFVVGGEAYLGIYRDPDNPYNRGKLTIMAEQEFSSLSIEAFCSGVYDAVMVYGVRSVYVDYDEKDPEYYDLIVDYGYKHKLTRPRFTDAPFKANFHAGIAQVEDWGKDGLLEIPDGTVVYQQMKGMPSYALDDPNIEQTKYAANALRYLVSGFLKFRPNCYGKRETWRNRNRRGMAV